MLRVGKRGYAACAALIGAALLCGIPASAGAQALVTRVYTEADGLPSTTVYDVAQGPDGRVWFATRSGIAVYDGADWQHFGIEDGLPEPSQRFVMIDARGDVWAVSADRFAVARLPAGALSPARPAEPAAGRWIAVQARAGRGATRGLLVNAAALLGAGEGAVVAVAGSGEMWLLRGDRFHRVSFPQERASVYSISAQGSAFVAATDRGLFRVDPHEDVASGVAAELDGPVYAFHRDPLTGVTWTIGRNALLARLPDGTRRRYSWSLEVASRPWDFVVTGDRYGGLYFGTSSELFYLPADAAPGAAAVPLGARDGLAGSGAAGLLRDREGNVWVATARGVTKIPSRRLLVYDRRHGLPADEVASVTELDDGTIVLGGSSWLALLDPRPGAASPRLVRFRDESEEARVLSLHRSDDGGVWAAVNRVGLVHVDRRGRTRHVATPFSSASAVFLDRDGALWIGSPTGLAHGRPGAFEPVRLPTGDGERLYVRAIDQRASGEILVATDPQGVYEIGADGVHHLLGGAPVLNNVYAVAEVGGEVWLGTAGGLATVRRGRIERLERPAIERPVYFVTPDRRGGVWLGTDHGAARWNGHRLRWLRLADGLPGLETNRGAGFEDSRGRFWIGTPAGVGVYQPRFDLPSLRPPLLTIAAVESAAGTVQPGGRVPPGDGLLRYRVRAISFVDERNVLFRHRLEGGDKDWSAWYSLPGRTLEFPRLAPGRYRIHLQARAVDGRISTPVVSGWTVLEAPLWRRPWVLVLAFLAAGATVYAGAALRTEHRLRLELERQIRFRLEQQKALLRELQRAHHIEALGVLAGGLAHDFNNLLAAILGNLGLIELDAPESGPIREAIAEAKAAVTRARSLTQQLLSFAKGGEPSCAPTDLAAVLRSSADIVLSGSNVDVEIDLDPELWPADADAQQIAQVIDNLLLNARQAMADGGTVRVLGRNVTDAPGILPHGRYVHLRVADEGTGIPADALDRVFDPYFTTRPDGKGLGLTIAESIVGRHGGRLEVHSEPGRGTVFDLWLPAAAPAPAAPPRERPRRPARVLVMDDEPALRHVVERMLARLGYEAEAARDGEEALRMFLEAAARERPFAAVLLDLTIPGGMGGVETARRLREIDPGLPIAVMTGYAEPVDGADAGRFQARLQKPFDAEHLEQLLAELLAASVPTTHSGA